VRRRIGYFRRTSHDVIDVESCPIITDELQETLTGLRADLDWQNLWSERVEIEAANSGAQVSLYSSEIVEPTAEISFQLDENRYFYNAQSFFQGNLFLIDALVETALKGAEGKLALDLYCGVGLFTLPLARKFEKVFGVEANEKAIESARKNLEHARLESAEVFADSVGDWLAERFFVSRLQAEFSGREDSPSRDGSQNAVDFILLDPPRAGTEKAVIENLLKIRPKEISYVSCEPSTLARDLRLLCESVYEIRSITALDLFPQTHHVETVVRLQLKAEADFL
jgi:23S rRNA (uracil1939-C5)-methyltransferase